MTHAQLRLIPVEGDPTHLRFASVADGWIELHLRILQFEGLTHGLQRLASIRSVNHAAHLHFAGGDQPQIDALLRQTREQTGGDAGATHHPRAADAQLRHPPFGREISPQALQQTCTDVLGPLQICLRHGEGDVVAAALMGRLDDQIDVDVRR